MKTDDIMLDALKRQNDEFRALDNLIHNYNIHNKVAVVDDCYPEVRYNYDNALRAFIDALRANGRIP